MRRVKRGWMNLLVTNIIEETPDTKTFLLEDKEEGGRAFDYDPGQYLTLRFDEVFEKPIVRSYTMSSSPVQGNFSALTIKRVPGGLVSNWICDHVKIGDCLRGRGPIGKFIYNLEEDQKTLIMLAAGSGVTPFISIMREYSQKPSSDIRMKLLVAYRSREDIICKREIEEIRKNPNFEVVITLTRENCEAEGFLFGRPNKTMYANLIRSHEDSATYMTCGPQEMMDDFVAFLHDKKIEAVRIKTESFA